MPVCHNLSYVCNNLIQYCDINYMTLKGWCNCLVVNHEMKCKDESYVSYVVYVISMFLVCLISCLFCILCKNMKKRTVDTPPPPYVSPPPPEFREIFPKEESTQI